MTTHTKKCSICPEQLTIMVLQKTPCDPPCQPRQMLGKSWHKLHGYNSGCKCAELAHNNSLVDINQALINDDDVCEKCGDSCDPFNQMDGHMKCPDCELFYTNTISYLQHRLEMNDDDDDIHICGETGKQYDTDPNPKLGCGIRCDDENGMIGNISYCIGCMEK